MMIYFSIKPKTHEVLADDINKILGIFIITLWITKEGCTGCIQAASWTLLCVLECGGVLISAH